MAHLLVIGSGDAFGSGGRLQTCFYLEAERRVLIDCGPSVLPGLIGAGIDPDSIDQIVLSHLHGDHFGGIPFLLRRSLVAHPRVRPLAIVGPVGTRDRIERTTELLFPSAPASVHTQFPLNIVEYEAGTPVLLDGVQVVAVNGVHSFGTSPHAVRVATGSVTIGYTGDTEWVDGLIAVADNADLFIAECYQLTPDKPNHLDLQTLMARRNQLRCRRLIITHMGPDVLHAIGEAIPERAYDGMRIEL